MEYFACPVIGEVDSRSKKNGADVNCLCLYFKCLCNIVLIISTKKAISCLNEILEKTGAEIVVSSDWKNWANVEEMGGYYEEQGIIKKPIAFTPDLGQCTWYDGMDFTFLANWDRETSRAIEIQQYLKDNPTITHCVAIDDLNMGKDEVWKDWALDNFVLTPISSEGIKQKGIQEKILRFLDA